ncbi:hypothetical protein QE250_05215 [Chromatiaceae bacterium AAb-1]|nr:hypothetical protein [Chromatiaceae bacterium AAb-1]
MVELAPVAAAPDVPSTELPPGPQLQDLSEAAEARETQPEPEPVTEMEELPPVPEVAVINEHGNYASGKFTREQGIQVPYLE